MHLRFSISLALALSLSLACTDQARKGRGQEKNPARGTDGPAFSFPNDRGGELLVKLLPPRLLRQREKKTARQAEVSAPLSPCLLVSLSPSLPPPPSPDILPHLPVAMRSTPLRPRSIETEMVEGLPESSLLPILPTLPVGRRVRIASESVHDPIPLPILARPALEPADVDDPTADASAAAARSASIPPRTAPAPFLKLILPDPFERRRSLDVLPVEPGPRP